MNTVIINNQNGVITDPKILQHLKSVLKSKVGDTLRIGVLNQDLYTGTIKSMDEKECTVQLSSLEEAQEPWFNLIIGLSRPQTIKKVLEHGTTFGAKSFHFFKAELSEKSYLDSKIFQNEAYVENMIDGLSQSGIYTQLPELKLEKFNPATQYQKKDEQKFILDLETNNTFSDLQIDFNLPIHLAFGPERGWTKNEINNFQNAGFKSVKISSSILRVEHAVYSAVSQLELIKLKSVRR